MPIDWTRIDQDKEDNDRRLHQDAEMTERRFRARFEQILPVLRGLVPLFESVVRGFHDRGFSSEVLAFFETPEGGLKKMPSLTLGARTLRIQVQNVVPRQTGSILGSSFSVWSKALDVIAITAHLDGHDIIEVPFNEFDTALVESRLENWVSGCCRLLKPKEQL